MVNEGDMLRLGLSSFLYSISATFAIAKHGMAAMAFWVWHYDCMNMTLLVL
jgi:hypothetical protein